MLKRTHLANKKVVVTGASSGIGLETVKRLLEEDCVILAAIKPNDKMPITHQRLYVQTCDVSVPEDLDALFTSAVKKLGNIDIFFANAGFAYYEQFKDRDWQHISTIFETNSYHTFYTAQKLKQMNGQRPFQFIGTASAMAVLPLPGYALYSATKAAVHSFAYAYRYELEKEQYFQVVYPIATRTAFFKEAGDSPVPWPSQSAEAVASAIIKGIKRRKRSIYPSKTFSAIIILNRFLPFVLKIYNEVERKKFQGWLDKKGS